MEEDNNSSSNYNIEDNIEKGNQLYYDEQYDVSCCTRFCGEFLQHPFTLLETNGRVLDIQRTFAAHPSYIVVPLKVLILVATFDVMIRDIITYTGTPSFYLAYYEQWTLIFCIVFLLLSTYNSISCSLNGGAAQPLPQENRAPLIVCFTWTMFPLALIASTLNFFMYWSLVYWDLGDIEQLIDAFKSNVTSAMNEATDDPQNFVNRLSYFALMKNWGILMLVIFQGQILDRIPLRWSHLTIAEFALVIYIGWTMIHDLGSDIGNPDKPDDISDDAIYSFMNWNGDVQELTLGSFVTMAVIIPCIWFVYYTFSWPMRRYMPIEERDDGQYEEEEDLFKDEENVNIMPTAADDNMILVPLVAGQKLGVNFKTGSCPPCITKVKETSQLLDYGISVGMVADTLTLSDGTVYYELETSELIQHLKDSKEEDGRILTFIDPTHRGITPNPFLVGTGRGVTAVATADTGLGEIDAGPGDDEVTVVLPAGSVGIILKDSPPRINSISDASPIATQIRVNLIVDTLTLEDGTVHYCSQLDSNELADILKTNYDSEGRIMRFINNAVIPMTKDPNIQEEEIVVEGDDSMPDEIELALPSGPLLLQVEGTPAKIMRMSEESPLHGTGVSIGMVVDTLMLEDGTMYYKMNSEQFKSLLKENSNSEGRIIKFVNPLTTALTLPPSERIHPEELAVPIPPGPIHVAFQGTPPVVTQIAPDSVLLDEYNGIIDGMIVDRLEVDDEMYYELDTQALTSLMKGYADSYGRTLYLIAPHRTVTSAPIPTQISIGEGGNASVSGSLPEVEIGLGFGGGGGGGAFIAEERYIDSSGGVNDNSIGKYNSIVTRTIQEEEELPEAEEELTEADLDTKQSLLDMGFEEETILKTIQYFKSIGEPVDADTCMTHIISE